MVNQVKSFIQKNKLIEDKDHIILGLSGGADSVCLFFLLQEIKADYNLTISVVHINHAIREEANRDELFVKELCVTYQVPFYAVTHNVKEYARESGLSLEEAGRILRYQTFYEYCKTLGATKIAVAHNENDQAETVLFQLCRGSGISGLKGILPRQNQIIRPLLATKREEIECYLKQNHYLHIQDESNFSNQYTRNRIRNQILPLLDSQVCENAQEHIASAGFLLAQTWEYMSNQIQKEWDEGLLEDSIRVYEGRIDLWIPSIIQKPSILQSLFVKKAIELVSGSEKDISKVNIEQTIELFENQTGKKISLANGVYATKTYDWLVIEKKQAESFGKEASFPIHPGIILKIPGRTEFMENAEDNKESTIITQLISKEEFLEDKRKGLLFENQYTKYFDYDKIIQDLVIRTRQPKDYFYVSPTSRQTIKAYMINQKIDPTIRDHILLIAEGNHVLWSIGHRVSNEVYVRDHTTKILKVTYLGGTDG